MTLCDVEKRAIIGRIPDQFCLVPTATGSILQGDRLQTGDSLLCTTPASTIEREGSRLIVGYGIKAGGMRFGRAAVVEPEFLYADDPLCSIYYDREKRIASNSLRVILELTGRPLRPPAILHGSRPDFYALPSTRAPGIQRLFPSQKLNLKTFTAEWRDMGLDWWAPSSTDPVQAVADALIAFFQASAKTGLPLCLALTGGFDSRTLLAAAVAAEVPVSTFTFDVPGVAKSDLIIPPRLAAIAGAPHQLVRRRKWDASAAERYRWWSVEQTAGYDVDIYARHQWDALPSDAIIIRGYGFEFVRNFYRYLDTDFRNGDALYERLSRTWVRPLQAEFRESLGEWVSWIHKHREPSITLPDRLYLEQRIAGWCAANEEALLITHRRNVNPAASGGMLRLMNMIPPELRTSGAWQVKLIHRLCPDLNKIPIGRAGSVERAWAFSRQMIRGTKVLTTSWFRHHRAQPSSHGVLTK